uniref:Uncharacterized protein n=1 Tax=Arundo donax TaxID=35708 RepID=A0A0A9PKQ0_ARUDO
MTSISPTYLFLSHPQLFPLVSSLFYTKADSIFKTIPTYINIKRKVKS